MFILHSSERLASSSRSRVPRMGAFFVPDREAAATFA